jgi:hypothetical protein
MKRIADLETSHVTQTTTEKHGKGEWVLYNEDRVEIHRFPASWNEKQVMTAIHFGRKFERIALNSGIDFQKERNPQTIKDLQALVTKLQKNNDIMREENIKISTELDALTLKNTE